MENRQYWGVCRGETIVKVYTNHDAALEESVMYTLETQVNHTVEPVVLKGENNESK